MVSTKGSLLYDMGKSVFGVGYANLEKTSGPCFLLGPCIGQIIQAEYRLSAVPLEKGLKTKKGTASTEGFSICGGLFSVREKLPNQPRPQDLKR